MSWQKENKSRRSSTDRNSGAHPCRRWYVRRGLHSHWSNTPKGSGGKLPVSLDVESFANVGLFYSLDVRLLKFRQARSFEIMAMQDSIANAR